MISQSVVLFEKIRAAVPEVVSSSGGRQDNFRISQWIEGYTPTEQKLSQVAAIIAAHNWNEPTNDQKLITKATALITDLEAEVSSENLWNGRSNAYRQEVVRRALLGLAKLARLVVGKLDSD